MKQKTGTSFVRFAALLLAALFAASSLFACKREGGPADGTGAPATSAPAEETEWPYGTMLCTLPVREGSLAAGFSSTGETRYVSVGVPVGFGGGYRSFRAQTDNAASLAGILELSLCDLLLVKGGIGEIPQTSETLGALLKALGETPEQSLTLMDHSALSLSGGKQLVTFFTFSRVGSESRNRSYSFLIPADGEYVVPFVCSFASADLFRRASTAATIGRIAESIVLQGSDFSVSLSDGLKTASFSLYSAIPEGMQTVAVSRYADRYAAVFVTDSLSALYVNLYEAGAESFSGDFVKVSERSQAVTVYSTENGVSLSDGVGGYWSVSGRPGAVKTSSLTRTLINAVYSPNGKYRAYTLVANGDLILENLNTGVQTTVRAGGAETAEPVAFGSGGVLLFSLSRGSETVGYGVYSVADGRVSEYRNGLSPIGIGGDTIWFWETAEGQRKRILKASLEDPSAASVAAERGGSAISGFFEGYLDILFDSQLSFDRSGEYFVLLPADDSRICLFSSSTYEQIYASAVPNLAEVIPVSGYLILGTHGWGNLYSIALPDPTSSEDGFSAESFVETKDFSPDYYDFLRYCELASGTLRESTGSVSVYEKQNLTYYLFAYAAENGYARVVSTQRYTVSLYHVESILWRLFGLDETYFTSYLNAVKLDGAYPGLLEGDVFNAESGEFEFTYKRSSYSAMERGGCVIRKTENELLVSMKQSDRSGMQRLFSYRFAAFRDESGKPFYRFLSAGEPSALSAPDVSELKVGKTYYTPFWFEVTEGGERAFYPLSKTDASSGGTGFFPIERDARARYEDGDPGIEFGEAVLCGERAVVPFSLGGIFDALIVNMKTGENRLLSGESVSSLSSVTSGTYATVRADIRAKGRAYPYAAAKVVLASGDGTRLLYLVSAGVDTLACRYHVYDLKTDKTAALSESHTGKTSVSLGNDAAEWMADGTLRLSVYNEKDGKAVLTTFDWKEKSGKWSGTQVLFRPDGDRWEAYTTARETAAPVTTTAPVTTAVTTATGTQKPQDTTAAGTETAASSAP
ncbi:MAG: hypothetical protein IJR89_00260 [Clostridia bacterium]|nr:hypothetical protein [Clostridia bacterium]